MSFPARRIEGSVRSQAAPAVHEARSARRAAVLAAPGMCGLLGVVGCGGSSDGGSSGETGPTDGGVPWPFIAQTSRLRWLLQRVVVRAGDGSRRRRRWHSRRRGPDRLLEQVASARGHGVSRRNDHPQGDERSGPDRAHRVRDGEAATSGDRLQRRATRAAPTAGSGGRSPISATATSGGSGEALRLRAPSRTRGRRSVTATVAMLGSPTTTTCGTPPCSSPTSDGFRGSGHVRVTPGPSGASS